METIGNYKVIRQLGESVEAASFLARDDEERRSVVLRRLLSPFYRDENICSKIDARLTRLARHDQLFSAEYLGMREIDGDLYLIREYVEGSPLAGLVEQKCYDGLEFYKIAIQIVRGLMVAHEHGVIHGRLTPSNVIVTERGYVRFTECGMSLDYDSPEQPEYIPTEIDKGIAPNETTDIFALGVLLYHMQTNEFPFPVGQPPADTDAPEFSSPAASAIPSEIRLLIEKMLSTDPAFRGIRAEEYLITLQEMLAASRPPAAESIDKLSQAGQKQPTDLPPGRWSGRSWLMISALSLLIVVVWIMMVSLDRL